MINYSIEYENYKQKKSRQMKSINIMQSMREIEWKNGKRGVVGGARATTTKTQRNRIDVTVLRV